jgi:hypothetical protein
MKKLIARLLFIPLTAIFLYHALSIVERFLTNQIYFCDRTLQGLPFQWHPVSFILFAFFVFWIAAHSVLEIAAYFKKDFNFSYWLRHLRYAPVAVLIFSRFIVIFFDAGMIQYSKWRVGNYVYGNSEIVAKPDFEPHNDYRGWCGNGYQTRASELYFEIAAGGLKDKNSRIRTRALLMTAEVADTIFNGTDTKRFNEILKKSCLDSDSAVRAAAQSVLSDRKTDCREFLLSSNK